MFSVLLLFRCACCINWEVVTGVVGLLFLGLLGCFQTEWLLIVTRVDGLRLMMVLLVCAIFLLCFCCTFNSGFTFLFRMFIYFLFFFLVGRFLSNRILSFYVFFELRVLPILGLILGWGSQPERIGAGSYLFLYTLVGSVPFLVKLVCLYSMERRLRIDFFGTREVIVFYSLFYGHYTLMVFFWVFVMLIKLPVYGVHLWLPKAHVEASTVGSMVLAGVILKLGGYGLYRVSLFRKFVLILGSGYLLS